METELFHEIYGTYFRAIEKLISTALKGPVDIRHAEKIVQDILYRESPWRLMDAIEKGTYAGVIYQSETKELSTEVKHVAGRPLTLLERRWLKTISLDDRVTLFECKFPDLEGIEPLYYPSDIYYCGIYSFGDPYDSEQYRRIFKTILTAVKENNYLQINYVTASGRNIEGEIEPQKLEYSVKEDRFRLFAVYNEKLYTFNLYRISDCKLGERILWKSPEQKLPETHVEVELVNQRRALERFLLYFSTYKKRTQKIGDDVFRVRITFPQQDETEVLINILSFIPMVKVLGPNSMRSQFYERIKRQQELFQLK